MNCGPAKQGCTVKLQRLSWHLPVKNHGVLLPAQTACLDEDAVRARQAVPQLMRLDIGGALVSAAGLAALRQLTCLEALSLDGTVQPDTNEPHYLAHLTRLTYLQACSDLLMVNLCGLQLAGAAHILHV